MTSDEFEPTIVCSDCIYRRPTITGTKWDFRSSVFALRSYECPRLVRGILTVLTTTTNSKISPLSPAAAASPPAGKGGRKVGVRVCSGTREAPSDKPGVSESVTLHSVCQMAPIPFGAGRLRSETKPAAHVDQELGRLSIQSKADSCADLDVVG